MQSQEEAVEGTEGVHNKPAGGDPAPANPPSSNEFYFHLPARFPASHMMPIGIGVQGAVW